jgi:hypothetical protein
LTEGLDGAHVKLPLRVRSERLLRRSPWRKPAGIVIANIFLQKYQQENKWCIRSIMRRSSSMMKWHGRLMESKAFSSQNLPDAPISKDRKEIWLVTKYYM